MSLRSDSIHLVAEQSIVE